MNDCLFCRIIRGEIPSKKVYEDEHTYAFDDINPQAPTHVLVVPKKHVRGLKEAMAEDAELIGYCQLAAANIARQRSIEDGYRTVLNVGPRAGQSVFHLHVHLLGGRNLQWPPGQADPLLGSFWMVVTREHRSRFAAHILVQNLAQKNSQFGLRRRKQMV
jgi:histidine triad (HIT) family protein